MSEIERLEIEIEDLNKQLSYLLKVTIPNLESRIATLEG